MPEGYQNAPLSSYPRAITELSSAVSKHIENFALKRARRGNKGRFPFDQNSGLKFRKFPVANGTVNREIFRLVTPARWDRIVPFSFGEKLPEIYDRKVLQGEIFPMEQ